MFNSAPLSVNQRDEEIHLNKKCKWKRRRKRVGYRWKRKCKCSKRYPEDKHIHSLRECSYKMVYKWIPHYGYVYVLEINCYCSHSPGIRRYDLKKKTSILIIYVVNERMYTFLEF